MRYKIVSRGVGARFAGALRVYLTRARNAIQVDILPDLKVQGFWIQTAIAGIARLTSPSPTDNALPVATILPKSRPRSTVALDPNFR